MLVYRIEKKKTKHNKVSGRLISGESGSWISVQDTPRNVHTTISATAEIHRTNCSFPESYRIIFKSPLCHLPLGLGKLLGFKYSFVFFAVSGAYVVFNTK